MDQYLDAQKARRETTESFIDTLEGKTKVLESKWELVLESHKELQRQKDLLSEKNGGSNVSDSDLLELNAGGLIITVTRSTLTQLKGTRLEAFFSGRWEDQIVRDSKGRIFLDVNSTCFKTLVDYLNERKIAPPDDLPDRPRTDPEHQVYLDSLITAFDLDEAVWVPKAFFPGNPSTTILTEQSHLRALDEFLAEDGIVGKVTLLYRGTRDGMDASTFHRLCDNQGPTVTVVKSSDGYIFGGFADKPWQSRSGSYTTSPKAFLFALHYSTGQFPVKMKQKPGRENHALYLHSSFGPTFGSGYDLFTVGSTPYTNVGHTYALPPGQSNPYFITGGSSQYFTISEIEVFKIDTTTTATGSSSSAVTSSSSAAISRPRPSSSSNNAASNEPWESLTFDEFPSDIQKKLKAEKDALALAIEELAHLQDAFEKEKQVMRIFAGAGSNNNNDEVEDDVVQLNVSGQIMATKRSTLGQIPDSVLSKQFNDPLWNDKIRKKSLSPREWSPEQVVEWAKSIPNLTEDISSQLSGLTGGELLLFGREDVKDLGVKRGTVAVLTHAIQKLRDDEAASSTTFIEHSDYCFGKILDHLRLKAMCKVGLPKPEPPKIREADQMRFKRIVEFYFPGEEKAEFLG